MVGSLVLLLLSEILMTAAEAVLVGSIVPATDIEYLLSANAHLFWGTFNLFRAEPNNNIKKYKTLSPYLRISSGISSQVLDTGQRKHDKVAEWQG